MVDIAQLRLSDSYILKHPVVTQLSAGEDFSEEEHSNENSTIGISDDEDDSNDLEDNDPDSTKDKVHQKSQELDKAQDNVTAFWAELGQPNLPPNQNNMIPKDLQQGNSVYHAVDKIDLSIELNIPIIAKPPKPDQDMRKGTLPISLVQTWMMLFAENYCCC